MFRNKSAWFSSSVPQGRHNFWTLEGGSVTGWTKADYLFSADATCPDTLRVFESKDYLWNKVVVFHCLFLTACEKRQSVKSVCIGHYVLPPASVQDEVRSVVGRLIWEYEDEPSGSSRSLSCHTEDENSDGEVSSSEYSSEPFDSDSSEREAPLCGYVSMDNLQRYCGDMCDFCPGCFPCSNCKDPAAFHTHKQTYTERKAC